MNFEILHFPNIGVLRSRLSEEDLRPIKEEIAEIQKNFNLAKPHNKQLVGNIRKEFELIKSLKYLDNLITPYIYRYNDSNNFLDQIAVLTKDCELVLDTAWVNFQEKYEFNPIHTHSGIMSFVIWIQIPYSIEDEITQSPGAKSSNPVAGHFSFHYINSIGKIRNQDVKADRTMENTLLLFPAQMNHSVSPFYTSDDFRISISGNYKFKVLDGQN